MENALKYMSYIDYVEKRICLIYKYVFYIYIQYIKLYFRYSESLSNI